MPETNFLQEFLAMRRRSTPWLAVRTPDYRATYLAMLKYEAAHHYDSRERSEPKLPKAVFWNCVTGPKTPIVEGSGEPASEQVQKELGTNEDAPFQVLRNALDMDDNAILFFVVPSNDLLENPFTIQAIADLREPFKGKGCMLVLIGPEIRLPALIQEDIPVLDDPLPDAKELAEVVCSVIEAGNKSLEASKKKPIELEVEEVERAASICLGMTRFAAEEAVARKLTDKGIDFKTLVNVQRAVVEQSSGNALKFEVQPWSFRDMGGADAFRDFMQGIYSGPRRPKIVVRVDEIDKNITSASTGTVADNTGVSQDLLRSFLLTLEDNDHLALLSVGPPGVGKTLSSIATGNEFGCKTLAFDMGAVKGSLVGESEMRMRRVMQIILAMGGRDVLWIATCNRVDTLPPELQARFWLGTWFWDLPTDKEKTLIWGIQRKRYEISPKDKTPADAQWVGRDIRNACRLAAMRRCTLEEAAKFITITGTVNAAEIERSRDTAQKKGYLSAALPGAYKRPEQRQTGRAMKN